MATYWENSCSFGLRYVSWYKYLIVSLVFSHLGFWSGNLFLIAPFPDLCLLVPFYSDQKICPSNSWIFYDIGFKDFVTRDIYTDCIEYKNLGIRSVEIIRVQNEEIDVDSYHNCHDSGDYTQAFSKRKAKSRTLSSSAEFKQQNQLLILFISIMYSIPPIFLHMNRG